LTPQLLTSSDFEGTLDQKKIKYRIVALALDGGGAVRRFGDESDFDVEDGIGFPPIPPARSPSRLPKLVCNTQVSSDTHTRAHLSSSSSTHQLFVPGTLYAHYLSACLLYVTGVEALAPPRPNVQKTHCGTSVAVELWRSE
jgi:hypothetical protein